MKAIVAGEDGSGLGDALEAEDVAVARVDRANGEALESAGIEDADLFVLTDVAQAVTIAVAKEANPDVRVVVYSADSLPDFARGQADFVLDPAALDPATVAEELA